MSTICGTGHRPDKLGGYDNFDLEKLCCFATYCLVKMSPTRVISGMALGWDQAIAVAALNLQIPLTAAVPFKGQERTWPDRMKEAYHSYLEKADEVVIVCEGDWHPYKMQLRNEWMVDHSALVLALWNGSKGGTANCIRYANKVKKPIINVWEDWDEINNQKK
jgi:uncharacterized phage-like protein YoqJ